MTEDAMRVVAAALKAAQAFLEGEGLSGTLEELRADFDVRVTEDDTRYFVDLSPWSGEGHDGQFTIDKRTGLLDPSSLAIGMVEPDPEEDEP